MYFYYLDENISEKIGGDGDDGSVATVAADVKSTERYRFRKCASLSHEIHLFLITNSMPLLSFGFFFYFVCVTSNFAQRPQIFSFIYIFFLLFFFLLSCIGSYHREAPNGTEKKWRREKKRQQKITNWTLLLVVEINVALQTNCDAFLYWHLLGFLSLHMKFVSIFCQKKKTKKKLRMCT